jgi:hypothetical protein
VRAVGRVDAACRALAVAGTDATRRSDIARGAGRQRDRRRAGQRCHRRKSGPQVHGSFTTGIGYSKGYGTSTMNAADLDVSGQTDSGRSYDMHFHVVQSKGPGFSPYAYGLRYR